MAAAKKATKAAAKIEEPTGLPQAEPDQTGQDGYVSEVAKAFDELPEGTKVQHVGQLTEDQEVAARSGPDFPADGKFRKVFVLSGRDYEANQLNDDMHRANEVATLQEALNKGVHPKGEARLESEESTHDGSVRLTYAVDGVPAHADEAPSETHTPAKAIDDMGGSTLESEQHDTEK